MTKASQWYRIVGLPQIFMRSNIFSQYIKEISLCRSCHSKRSWNLLQKKNIWVDKGKMTTLYKFVVILNCFLTIRETSPGLFTIAALNRSGQLHMSLLKYKFIFDWIRRHLRRRRRYCSSLRTGSWQGRNEIRRSWNRRAKRSGRHGRTHRECSQAINAQAPYWNNRENSSISFSSVHDAICIWRPGKVSQIIKIVSRARHNTFHFGKSISYSTYHLKFYFPKWSAADQLMLKWRTLVLLKTDRYCRMVFSYHLIIFFLYTRFSA